MAEDAGALLVRAGLIGEEQLLIARRAQTQRGGTLGEHLVLAGFVDDEDLTHFFHNRLMVPRMDPNKLARIPPSMIRRLPPDMAAEFRAVPVAIDRDQNLTVVLSDPSNNHAVDEIAFFTGCYVMRAVATQRQIAWCLAHYYGFITALGQTLLQPDGPGAPATPEVSPADGVPRAASDKPATSITGQVQALRHKVVPPETPDAADPEERSTGPMRAIPGKPAAPPPSPPELQERIGEVMVRGETDATPSSSRQDLPAVVVDAGPEPVVEIYDESVPVEVPPADSEPVVILDRPRPREPEDEDEDAPTAEVVVLDTPKRAPTGGRKKSQTAVGIGAVGRNKATARHDLDPAARRPAAPPDPAPAAPAAPAPAAPAEPTGDRPAVGKAGRPEVRKKDDTGESNVDTGQFKKVDYEYDEDEWEGFGPPGTTIPPGFLGAMPDADATGTHNAIPIATDFDDSGGEYTQPNPVDPVAALAHTMEDVADTQRELDQSATRLVETLRALDRAPGRDQVVDALLDHLSRSFNRCCFLVIKGEELTPFRTKGIGPFAPSWKGAAMSITDPSLFRDVISSRMPFRGEAVDFRARAFASAIFGAVPDELVVVPLAVRERIVGVLLAGDRFERIFQEHVAVVARAAGESFERILKLSKR